MLKQSNKKKFNLTGLFISMSDLSLKVYVMTTPVQCKITVIKQNDTKLKERWISIRMIKELREFLFFNIIRILLCSNVFDVKIRTKACDNLCAVNVKTEIKLLFRLISIHIVLLLLLQSSSRFDVLASFFTHARPISSFYLCLLIYIHTHVLQKSYEWKGANTERVASGKSILFVALSHIYTISDNESWKFICHPPFMKRKKYWTLGKSYMVQWGINRMSFILSFVTFWFYYIAFIELRWEYSHMN